MSSEENSRKKTRLHRPKFIHENRRYTAGRICKETIYYRCADRLCRGRVIKKVSTGEVTLSQEHTCRVNPSEKAKEEAIDRLRELTIGAEDGVKAIEIVRRLFKELSPETRAVLPNEDRLTERVRRWAKAGGVELTRATFQDYLVEDGLEVPAIPPPDPSTTASDTVKNEPSAGPAEGVEVSLKKPDLVFLKGHAGEKLRVMIEDKIYIWNRDLAQGGTLYKCLESRIGCRVTVKIYPEKKQYEIRGTHVHELKTLPSKSIKKRPVGGLKLVDEEGRDLRIVDVDNILTAGDDVSNFALDYDNLPRADSASNPRPTATSGDDAREDAEMPNDSNDLFGGGDDFDDDNDAPIGFDDIGPDMEDASARDTTAAKGVPASPTVRKRLKRNGVRSGEKCFVCGDDLIVSETLSSTSEETFRKACCYLNVKSNRVWFPRKSDGQFYSFCESCTNEVTRIHELYKKVEEIQSLIFRKVEHVEKRIADAEIVDNWMADTPATYAIRFEGFRKQVLTNYRNKLRLRREIRVGAKLGEKFTEIQPISTAHMFASDPTETNAFRKAGPLDASDAILADSSAAPEASPVLEREKRRGRSKSKKSDRSPETILQDTAADENSFDMDNDVESCEFLELDDDAMSEQEVKFWQQDPSRLHVEKDTDGSDDDNNENSGADKIDLGADESDPDYDVHADDDDEDWGTRKTKRAKGANRRRGRPRSKIAASSLEVVPSPAVHIKSWTERFAEARAARATRAKNKTTSVAITGNQENSRSKTNSEDPQQKPHKIGDFELPDAVLTKDGRMFLSGIEIIKNPPGLLKMQPSELSFTCGSCGKIIRLFWSMKLHICGQHLGTFKCNPCGKQFANPKSLGRHTKWVHSGKLTSCSVCGKPLHGNPEFHRYHIWSHLGEEEKKDPQYKNYLPPSKKDPNRIKASHGRQTFMCSYCPKTYFRTGDLRKHELAHTSKDTFQCQFCGKILADKRTLYHHSYKCGKKAKGADETCACPKCPVRFKSRTARARHIKRFHKNVTDSALPFSCPKCPRSFSTKNACKSHRRICQASPDQELTDFDKQQPSTSLPTESHGIEEDLPFGSNVFGDSQGGSYYQPHQ